MKFKLNLIILFICFPFSIMASEEKPSLHRIVVFGDSLSDNGNYFKASKGSEKPMPLPPYYQGRATNGLVWTEYLSTSIGAQLDSHAYIGALTKGKNPRYPAAIDMSEQIDHYLKNLKEKKEDPKNTLFVIWAGANNIFTMDVKEPIRTFKSLWNLSGDIMKGVEKLRENGARTILVSNIPDLGKIPLTVEVDDFKNMKWLLSAISKTEDFVIAKRVNRYLLKHKEEDFKIIQFDAKNMLAEIEKNPTKYNVKESDKSCYFGVPSNTPTPNVACTNSKDFLFWDFVHPTTKIHCLAAFEIQKRLSTEFKLPIPTEENFKNCKKL